jgi:class 3 adenylate cyclase
MVDDLIENAKPQKFARKKCRTDFISEVVGPGREPGMFNMRFQPDPRRYDQATREGKTYYIDRYLKMLFSLEEMVEQMAGLPIYHLAPSIGCTPEYAQARLGAVKGELETGTHIAPSEGAKPHHELKNEAAPKELVFLSVDIVGSTAARISNGKAFDKAYELFISELGTIVGQFEGTILKTKGDGFIAYIDHPSFCSQCDSAIDLGLSMLVVIRDTINPALIFKGLKPIKVRIGADYGEVQIKTLRVPATGFTTQEVASDALNRAVKIEESCAPGSFRIGRDLYELIHVQWLERSTEVSFDGSTVGIDDYRVYEVA